MIIGSVLLIILCLVLIFLPSLLSLTPGWKRKFDTVSRMKQEIIHCHSQVQSVADFYSDQSLGVKIELSHTFIELWYDWSDDMEKQGVIYLLASAFVLAVAMFLAGSSTSFKSVEDQISSATHAAMLVISVGVLDVMAFLLSLWQLYGIYRFYRRKERTIGSEVTGEQPSWE